MGSWPNVEEVNSRRHSTFVFQHSPLINEHTSSSICEAYRFLLCVKVFQWFRKQSTVTMMFSLLANRQLLTPCFILGKGKQSKGTLPRCCHHVLVDLWVVSIFDRGSSDCIKANDVQVVHVRQGFSITSNNKAEQVPHDNRLHSGEPKGSSTLIDDVMQTNALTLVCLYQSQTG